MSSPNENSKLAAWKRKLKEKRAAEVLANVGLQKEVIPSLGQKRLWFLQQLNPQSHFYHYGHLFTFRKAIDVKALNSAFDLLLDQHPILRYNFKLKEQEIAVVVNPQTKIPFEFIDLSRSASGTEEEHTELAKITKTFTHSLFDLEKDLLIRILVIKLLDNHFKVMLSMHHIIGDRHSLEIIKKEVFSNYIKLSVGTTPSVPERISSFNDFAHSEKNKETSLKTKAYWKSKLAGDIAMLIPTPSLADTNIPKSQGKLVKLYIEPELKKQITKFAKEHQTTKFITILSAFKILLHHYTNSHDLTVGTPISKRNKIELQDTIGFITETYVLRSALVPQNSFTDFVKVEKNTLLDAIEHGNISYDEIVEIVQPERDKNENPLFQNMFLYNSEEDSEADKLGLLDEEEMLDLQVSKFNLTLFANEKKDGLELLLEFTTSRYSEAFARQFLQHLQCLIGNLVATPELPITEIPYLSTAEVEQIVEDQIPLSSELSFDLIHSFIEKVAQNHPDKIAVSCGVKQITYGELQKEAKTLSQIILEKANATSPFVGILADRSIEMVIGILAVLKAGYAYLPLDPQYPDERLRYMLKDSGSNMLLTHAKYVSRFATEVVEVITFESLDSHNTTRRFVANPTTQDFAYLIYTSGSSGKPKGVPISHQNLCISLAARFEYYIENPTSFLLLSSFSFDSSVAGIFWTLSTGGNLVIGKDRIEQDINLLSQTIAQHKVSHTLLLPSLYQVILQLSDPSALSSLRTVIVAGEASMPSLTELHFGTLPTTKLYNEYGPTEATVWCIAHEITSNTKGPIPIGKSVPGYGAFILNKELQPVARHIPGDLYIASKALSKGYFGDDMLSREKFKEHSFNSVDKIRLYETGDRALWNEDNDIVFLGRADHQIKILGHRIEISEIISNLTNIDGIKEASIKVQENASGQKRLVAYFASMPDLSKTFIFQELRKKLPHYMVPYELVRLERLPKLPNGKVDTNALLPLKFDLSEKQISLPKSETEKQLTKLWEEILGIEQIGIDQNFFKLGGDSILSIQIVSKAREKKLPIEAQHIFEFQTIRELAAKLDIIESLPAVESPTLHSNINSYGLTEIQKAFLFNSQAVKDEGLLILEFPIQGPVDAQVLKSAWDYVSTQHVATRLYISKNGTEYEQVVSEKCYELQYQDLTNSEITDQLDILAHEKQNLQKTGIDLFKAQEGEIKLYKLGPDRNLIVWTCHHIFLDGWSCGIIFKELLKIYTKILENKQLDVSDKNNFLSYLEWKDQENHLKAKEFWTKALENYKPSKQLNRNTKESGFSDLETSLSEVQSNQIRSYCTQHSISASTFFQSNLILMLTQILDRKDIVFGLTVSGRNANFERINQMSGLFMNTVPARIRLEEETTIDNLQVKIQNAHIKRLQHENISLNKIQDWINWPISENLYETLFVYGSFLESDLDFGTIKSLGFEGGFSSNLPLTIRIIPGKNFQLNIRHDLSRIGKDAGQLLMTGFCKGLEYLLKAEMDFQINRVRNNVYGDLDPSKFTEGMKTASTGSEIEFPTSFEQNTTSQKILNIWKDIFNTKELSLDDNFFEIGGKSLLALSLFSKMEHVLKLQLSPNIIFSYPTVRKLSAFIDGDKSHEQDGLIAFRDIGDKPPLFCIHGGGAHVFFYKDLAKYLPEDQPLYSFIPKGLNGKQNANTSIEEMASYYISKMRTIQASGPYHLLGTCFSNAVAIEMAHQLNKENEELEKLFIIDSAPVHLFGDDQKSKTQTLKRFLDMLKRGDISRIKSKIKSRFFNKNDHSEVDLSKETDVEKNLRETIDALNRLYANYTWKPYSGKINFIRSSEFDNRTDKKYHLSQWKKLALGGIDVSVVQGHHISLFEEPEVEALAQKINDCLAHHIN